MTKIKLCGLTRPNDIEAVNELMPEYIGFVFAKNSRRYISPEEASKLKKMLNPRIKAVGVFVNEKIQTVAKLLNSGVIDLAQLHGAEDDRYIEKLRSLTLKPIIKAFQVESSDDIMNAQSSKADFILLDSGKGSGQSFDWELIKNISRPYFLAGGLDHENITTAVRSLKPYAVDLSSGIETDGVKDKKKMTAFTNAVRKEDTYE